MENELKMMIEIEIEQKDDKLTYDKRHKFTYQALMSVEQFKDMCTKVMEIATKKQDNVS